jgi:ADP-ribose pyrophosphatase YjhB (NUDIX family)
MGASRIIIFSPDKTKYLVGRESFFISNIPSINVDMKAYMDILFSRKIEKVKDHNDKNEVEFYTRKLNVLLKNKEIMSIVKEHANSNRITFGDIRYKKINNQLFSYTIPQYVPVSTPLSFPGGQPYSHNSDMSCAIREFHEEAGIDLTKPPYSIDKLTNTKKMRGNYIMFYYILNNEEYSYALNDIKTKNKSAQAELHDLQFTNNLNNLSINARKNIRKTRKIMRYS